MRIRKKTVVFIVGPTAIGKTRLGIKLAKRVNGEIVSADSMQVYKGMAILNQAPLKGEMRAVKHHLIGVLSPGEECSAAGFKKKAARIIKGIIRRGRMPIVVGGSGLYVKALIDGLFPSPEADPRFRKNIHRYISRHGGKRAHAKLARIDPEAALLIHPNDSRRIVRALEIFHSTGKTMTELKKMTRGLEDIYDIKIFGLARPREEIYADIDKRVDKMFSDGVLNEINRLSGKNLSLTAKAVLGFKELIGYLNGEYDLAAAKDLLKRNTRRFAKRQLAWFKGDRRIKWFDVKKLGYAKIEQKIVKEVS